jgi:phosphatidylinositol-bisphosphatase
MIRGSIPAFWVQHGKVIDVGASVKITRSLDLTQQAFSKHFNILRANYGDVMCVNLIGDGKNEKVKPC